jgi:hypothetical protein
MDTKKTEKEAKALIFIFLTCVVISIVTALLA